jgi:hypothetical protein
MLAFSLTLPPRTAILDRLLGLALATLSAAGAVLFAPEKSHDATVPILKSVTQRQADRWITLL